MSHKDKILDRLKSAGDKGVLSKTFYQEFMPRFAARILDLKNDGYTIWSEREGQYTRYTLITEEQMNLL